MKRSQPLSRGAFAGVCPCCGAHVFVGVYCASCGCRLDAEVSDTGWCGNGFVVLVRRWRLPTPIILCSVAVLAAWTVALCLIAADAWDGRTRVDDGEAGDVLEAVRAAENDLEDLKAGFAEEDERAAAARREDEDRFQTQRRESKRLSDELLADDAGPGGRK